LVLRSDFISTYTIYSVQNVYMPYLIDSILKLEDILEWGVRSARPSSFHKITNVLESLWSPLLDFSSFSKDRVVDLFDGFW
jgi:hypothetical protein